jgi:hypothetical protein
MLELDLLRGTLEGVDELLAQHFLCRPIDDLVLPRLRTEQVILAEDAKSQSSVIENLGGVVAGVKQVFDARPGS